MSALAGGGMRARRAWRAMLWLALALPAGLMLDDLRRGAAMAMELVEPSGEMAARLLVLALLPGPLAGAFGANRWLRGWLAARRDLGLAAFAYAGLHLAFYAIDLGRVAAMLDELGLPGIWTGWLAMALMLPAAATSCERAIRALGRRWKRVQRLVRGAAVLTLAHWLLLEWNGWAAAAHFAPLAVAWLLRESRMRRSRGLELERTR